MHGFKGEPLKPRDVCRCPHFDFRSLGGENESCGTSVFILAGSVVIGSSDIYALIVFLRFNHSIYTAETAWRLAKGSRKSSFVSFRDF
jgi:hypothetical protein